MEEEAIKQKENGHLLGIIGAIIGGIIGTIPWILVYVYGNMMLSVLAAIIAAGAFYGYKLFKGKIDNKLPAIIMIISIVLVTITTLVVIPLFLIHMEGLKANLETLKYIYANSGYAEAVIQDFVISIIFTILGARIITSNIKNQIQNGNEKIDLSNSEQVKKQTEEEIKALKPIFTKYEATSKEKGIMREEVVAEFDNSIKAGEQFNHLKSLGIIKKSKGKFYYSEENENNREKKAKKVNAAVIALVVLALIVIVATGLSQNKPYNTSNVVEDAYVKYEVPGKWTLYDDVTEEYIAEHGWDYYRYINNLPNTEEKQKEFEEAGKEDYEHSPALLNVYYSYLEAEIKDVQELKEILESNIKKEGIENYTITEFKTKKGYSGAECKLIEKNQELVDILRDEYYILNDDKIGIISGASYILEDEKEIAKDVKEVADSFEWK